MNRTRKILITLLLCFVLGALFLPSQAQRSPQKSTPTPRTHAKREREREREPVFRPRQKPDDAKPDVPIYAQAVAFAESAPVRDIGPAKNSLVNTKPGPPEIDQHEVNEKNGEEVRKFGDSKVSFDGALQRTMRAPNAPQTPSALPTPSITFDGVSAADEGNSVAPPDTNGDVGPNHFVQTVNNRVGIWDKSGNKLVPFFTQSTLFASLGGLAATVDRGDPVVLYDRMADRWLISQFAFTGQTTPPYHEAVAISKTGDPTGAYYLYDFVLPGNEFPDYPKFGVWPDGYYMTSNQFLMGGGFDGGGAFAFDRKKMLVGDPTAGIIYFNLNLTTHPEGIFGMLPSDHDGILPPPAGSPNVFLYFTNTNFGDPANGVRLFDFHADFAVPANSTFTERPESTYAAPVPLAAFDARNPGGRGDIEQPPPAGNNSTDRLDSISTDTMYRLQYFNRNGNESLVSNFTVNVSGVTPNSAANYQAGFRYFELRRSTPSSAYSVVEQATFAPGAGNGATGDNRWLGSAAIDNQENLAVAYSISGVTAGHFPSLNYAARAFNDPPGGLFQGEGTLFAGTGVQRGTTNRWGDYSSLQVDPADDCTFWFTSEYYTSTTSTFNWRTRIGAFKFATCSAPPQGTLSGTITACDTGVPISNALIEVSGGPSSGFSTASIANGTYSMKLAPGNYIVNIGAIGHSCMAVGPFNVTITDGATTTLNQCLSGSSAFIFQSAAISGGDGDGVIEANECNNLNVVIKNDGCLTGTNVSAVLSSTTTGVTITQPNSPYPNTQETATATNTVPFSVSTSPSFVCGTTIQFTLTVSFSGGSSSFSFSLPTCVCPPTIVTGALAAGDLTQTGRLGRDGVANSCAIPKACPGAIAGDTNQHLYDLYTFTNGPTAACVTITTTATCPAATNPIITVAYLGTFVPTNFCTNYLGDPGGSPAQTNSFQVNVPANGVLVLNVQEITAGTGCSGYSVTVSGLICNTPGTGPCAACQITCPANITAANDPNQCGAVVNYSAPTTTGTCGVVTCTPPTGSFFPTGTTTVTCATTSGPSCPFTVTVNDTQPPTVGPCPANITALTNQNVCPSATCQVVTYTLPPASDNCPGVTVACNPPSGSCFPLGVTSVTCTATDTSGNTATCSFTVTTFDCALQDDSNPSTILLWNSVSGAYRFCCNGVTYTGMGTPRKSGCVFSLDAIAVDRRVNARLDKNARAGSASLQAPAGVQRCTITDKNTLNDSNLTNCH